MEKYQVKLEQFAGPLELLLQLILEEKLDITQIALAKVAEQYLKHLEEVEELYPEELADFLVVATKLLVLKSRAMLPYLEWGEEEEGPALEDQLKIYKEFHAAALQLEARIAAGKFTYGRVDDYFQSMDPIFSPPQKFTAENLKNFFIDVLKRLEPIVRLPKMALSRTVSLQEKIGHLQNLMQKNLQLSFKTLLGNAQDRQDIVLTFLALLELVKRKTIKVKQDNNYEDIQIEKI